MTAVRHEVSLTRAAVRAATLLPFAFAAIAWFGAQSFFGPPPPRFLGIPTDLILLATFLGWALIGAGLAWNATSPLRTTLGILVFSVPACVAILFGPALLLILQNLA